jgi:hypothetical protein
VQEDIVGCSVVLRKTLLLLVGSDSTYLEMEL